eukprot:m.167913 g.167913  ORF g.167913 m.167913 type:complete len:492 (-) comp16646_c0_seq4:693-2168(-)
MKENIVWSLSLLVLLSELPIGNFGLVPDVFDRCDINIVNGVPPSLANYPLKAPRVWRNKTGFSGISVADLREFGSQSVKVGNSHSIVENGGDGSHFTTLTSFLNYLETGQLSSWQQPNTSCSSVPRSSTGIYLFDRGEFMQAHPALLSAANVPNLWPSSAWQQQRRHLAVGDLLLGSKDQLGVVNTYLLLGGNGSGVSFHFHTDSTARIHQGLKLWLFYPPETPPPFAINRHATVSEWLEHHHHRGLDPNIRLCLTRPGDLIHVPANWHHATVNYGSTLAFASQPYLAMQPTLAALIAAAQLIAQGRISDVQEILQEVSGKPLSPAYQRQLSEVKYSHYLMTAKQSLDTGLIHLLSQRYQELKQPSCSIMAQACELARLAEHALWADVVCVHAHRRCPYHGKALLQAGMYWTVKQDFERAQDVFLQLRLLPESRLHSLARMQLTNLALAAPTTFQRWFDEARCYDPDSPALERQAELFATYHGGNHNADEL